MESNDFAVINIRRDRIFAGGVIPFNVVVNGIVVGNIKFGQEKDFIIKPGENTIQVKTLLRNSNLLVLKTTHEEVITLVCGIDSSGLYLRDPSRTSDMMDNSHYTYRKNSFDEWLRKRWYIALICIVLASAFVGAAFPNGVIIGGIRLSTTTGFILGSLLTYMIYKFNNG